MTAETVDEPEDDNTQDVAPYADSLARLLTNTIEPIVIRSRRAFNS